MNQPITTPAWIAGLYEGEGCLTYGKKDNRWRLQLCMTDRDVVQRFADFVGAPSVRSGRARDRRKMVWRCQVAKPENIERVINMIYPFLGERRLSKADEFLYWYVQRQRNV